MYLQHRVSKVNHSFNESMELDSILKFKLVLQQAIENNILDKSSKKQFLNDKN